MERRKFLYNLVIGGVSLAAGEKLLAEVEIERFRIIIERNHGHTLRIPDRHTRDNRTHRYNIRGRSLHPHTVTITRQQFARILDGEMIRVMSSRDAGHRHRVNITWV